MYFKKALLPTAIAAVISASMFSPSAIAFELPDSGYEIDWDTIVTDPISGKGALHTIGNVTGNISNDGQILGNTNESVGNGIQVNTNHTLTGNINTSTTGTINGLNAIHIDGTLTGNITNAGNIAGTENGIHIGASGSMEGDITNNAEGSITGKNAISLDKSLTGDIINKGELIGTDNGIFVGFSESSQARVNNITNEGLIRGGSTGVDISGAGIDGLLNHGTIEGKTAIFIDGVPDDMVKNAIENHGTLRSTSAEHAAIHSVQTIGYGATDENADDFGLINHKAGVIENTQSGGTAILLEDDAKIQGVLRNDGTIRTIGDGIAIHLKDNALISAKFDNNGSILAGNGTAIHLQDNAKLTGGFRNEGTIQGRFAIVDESQSSHTLTNDGLVDGQIHGTNLTLDNDGRFRTEQGSTFAEYRGEGEIVAILSDSTKADEAVINVSGTAEFSAGSKVLVEGKRNDFTATLEGNEYIILEANALVIDGLLSVGSESTLLEVTLKGTDNNQITVIVKANDAGEIIGGAGASEEDKKAISSIQQEVLENISEDDPVYKMFTEASKDPEALKQLARDLQPETSGADVAGATATQSATFGSVANRTSSLRSGTNTGDLYQSGGVWGQLLHSKAVQDTKNNINGFNSHLSGFTLGTDADLNDNWTLGVALTAAKGTTNTKNSSNSTDTDSVIGTVYASWQDNDWFADMMASIGQTKNEGERLSNLIKSEYDANQYGLRLTLGKDILLNKADILIQPTAAFNYGRVDVESYKEKGSAAALAVQAQRYETIELGAGVKALKSIKMDRGVLNASLNLNGWHDFAADQVKTQSRFLTGTTILTSTGNKPEKTTWQAGAGLDYMADNDLTFSLNYDHSWKKGMKSDSVTAKLRYDF